MYGANKTITSDHTYSYTVANTTNTDGSISSQRNKTSIPDNTLISYDILTVSADNSTITTTLYSSIGVPQNQTKVNIAHNQAGCTTKTTTAYTTYTLGVAGTAATSWTCETVNAATTGSLDSTT